MKLLSLIVAVPAFLFLGACERHSWEDVDSNGDGKIGVNEEGTKRLYKDHDDHSGGHSDESGKKDEQAEPKKDH